MHRFYIFVLYLLAFSDTSARELTVGFGIDCRNPESVAISIKNPQGLEQRIPEAMLPWNSPRLVRWVAYALRDGTSIKLKRIHVAGNYIRDAAIPERGYLDGKINLAAMFLDFAEQRRKSDIIVFFELPKTEAKNGLKMIANTGFLFFPKRGIFTDSCPVLVQSPKKMG